MARKSVILDNLPLNPKGIPQIKFELFGKWEESMKLFGKLGYTMKIASLRAQLKIGKDIVTEVKGHLRKQDLAWAALDKKYADKKAAAGLNTKTLMAYGTYYSNINTWQEGSKHMVLIGVKKGIYTRTLKGSKSKLDVATIAGIHEFSSGKRIPRRPLWNPSIMKMGGAPGIKKMYIRALIWHLRRLGVSVVHKNGNVINMDGFKANPFK